MSLNTKFTVDPFSKITYSSPQNIASKVNFDLVKKTFEVLDF